MKTKTIQTTEDFITTLRVKDSLRRRLMIEKQELSLKNVDELLQLLLNTHYLHNRNTLEKEEKEVKNEIKN